MRPVSFNAIQCMSLLSNTNFTLYCFVLTTVYYILNDNVSVSSTFFDWKKKKKQKKIFRCENVIVSKWNENWIKLMKSRVCDTFTVTVWVALLAFNHVNVCICGAIFWKLRHILFVYRLNWFLLWSLHSILRIRLSSV